MAKKNKPKQSFPMQEEPKMVEAPKNQMTLEEARAFRAALYRPQPKPLNEVQKREAFRIFWASNKSKYGKGKSLEKAIWLHLKSIGMDSPEKFHDGLGNFGLKKVK
jgi:hypothetical protein